MIRSKAGIVHAVVLPVPASDRLLRGREKVRRLSVLARQALVCAAEKSGVRLGSLEKDAAGAPLPSRGAYWSLTHKECYVGAVVAAAPVGIDLEAIVSFAPGLVRKINAAEEWALDDGDSRLRFFRYWTSKEAVLKAAGVGLRDLSRCRVVRLVAPERLLVRYRDADWPVEHFIADGHIASVACSGRPVRWHWTSGSKEMKNDLPI